MIAKSHVSPPPQRKSGQPGEDRVGEVQRMFAGLREAVAARVADSTTFSYHSRQAAVDKLHAMGVQVSSCRVVASRGAI